MEDYQSISKNDIKIMPYNLVCLNKIKFFFNSFYVVDSINI